MGGGGRTLAGERAIKSFSPQDNAWFFCGLFFFMVNTVPQPALVPLGALPLSPPFPSAGWLWQAEAQLNSSTFSAEPQTTISYYYGRLPPLPRPPGCPAAPLDEDCAEGGRPPRSIEAWAFRVLRSFSAPGTNAAESRRLADTRIHAYSGAVSVHILAHRPLLPPSSRSR